MLAFDIETLGLNPEAHAVTCVCAYDPDARIERTFLCPTPETIEEFFCLLDSADRICAFNGARFDLPFLQRRFGVDLERVGRWRRKLHDPFEACKLALDRTFPLKDLLSLNGVPGKTGSGADAITLAKQGNLQAVGEYCMNDTVRTHQAASLDRIRLPRVPHAVLTREGVLLPEKTGADGCI